MPRGLVAMTRSGGHCPLRVSGGILCSERGQSRDAFQAIPLEETSPRCNNILYIDCILFELISKEERANKQPGMSLRPISQTLVMFLYYEF